VKHIALFCRWFNQKEILRFSSQAPPLMNAPGPAAVGGAAAEATGIWMDLERSPNWMMINHFL
jgi:hypothetical protein